MMRSENETHKTSLKSLIEFYTFLLDSGSIQVDGSAHSRLKELKAKLKKRNNWKLSRYAVLSLKNFKKN